MTIIGHEIQPFRLGLGDQQTVKGIAMVRWQSRERLKMRQRNGEAFETLTVNRGVDLADVALKLSEARLGLR